MNTSGSTRSIVVCLLLAVGLVFVVRGNADKSPKNDTDQAAKTSPPVVIPLSDLTGASDAVKKRGDQVQKVLDGKITIDLSNRKLSEALQLLSEKEKLFRFRIHMNYVLGPGWKFKNTSRREILNKLFVSSAHRWDVEYDTVWIRDAGDTPRRTIRLYRIADLALPKASRRARRERRFSGFGGQVDDREGQAETDYDWLLELLRHQTSGPWFEEDGQGGGIAVVNGVLRVLQDKRVHDEVAGLLAALRAGVQGKYRGNMMFIHERGYPAAEDAAIIKRWSQNMTIDIKGRLLPEAIEMFSKAAGIPMRINYAALNADGFGLKQTFTLNAKDAVIYPTLEKLLDSAEPRLRAFLHRGELMILPLANGQESFEAGVYDVRDLVASGISIRQIQRVVSAETSGTWTNQNGIGGFMTVIDEPSLIVFNHTRKVHLEIAKVLQSLRKQSKLYAKTAKKPKNQDAVETRIYVADDATQAKELVRVLPKFVATNSWKDDKTNPAIEVVDQKLIIRQTLKVHAAIRTFLDNLATADRTDRLTP